MINKRERKDTNYKKKTAKKTAFFLADILSSNV